MLKYSVMKKMIWIAALAIVAIPAWGQETQTGSTQTGTKTVKNESHVSVTQSGDKVTKTDKKITTGDKNDAITTERKEKKVEHKVVKGDKDAPKVVTTTQHSEITVDRKEVKKVGTKEAKKGTTKKETDQQKY